MITKNSTNNKWLTENPLFKNKKQRDYYDFGTGNKIEREDVKKERDAFLEGFNSVGTIERREKETGALLKKEPEFTKFPFYPSQEVKLEKFPGNPNKPLTLVQYATGEAKDPWGPSFGGDLKSNEDKELFLEGFTGVNKQPKNKVQNTMDKKQADPFLEGFNQGEERNKWLPDLLKEKNSILNPHLPNDTNRAFGLLGTEDGKLNTTMQKLNSSPTITPAINRNLNAKNEFEHAIGDPNKEPVMVQYSNESSDKYGRSNKDGWSLKNDEQGVSILSHWLFGGGKDYIQEDGVWGNYMKSNEALTLQVKKIVLPLADDLGLNDSKEVDITIPMEIDTGESIIGYQYLHGTNADVGGFQIKGTVYKDEKGDVTYDLTYTWNDIIDPNYYYPTDVEKAEFAKSIPFANPKDYIIRISWHDKTKIKANPGWFNRNSGWLK